MTLFINEDRGLGRKTIVSILGLSGLVQKVDLHLIESIVDIMIGTMFHEEKFRRGMVLKPTEACRQATEATLNSAIDPESLRFALNIGKTKHWKIRYADRATGTDNES